MVTLLCTDFLLTVLAALVVGMVLVELLMPIFLRYSLIQDADFSNYRSILFYILSVSVVMMAIVVLWVWLFQKAVICMEICIRAMRFRVSLGGREVSFFS